MSESFLFRRFSIRARATLGVSLFCASLHAEGADAELRTAARELAREAAELADAGRCDTAIDKFRRAYALVPAPTIAVHEARCLVQLGRLLEASDRYELVLRTPIAADAPAAYRLGMNWLFGADSAP